MFDFYHRASLLLPRHIPLRGSTSRLGRTDAAEMHNAQISKLSFDMYVRCRSGPSAYSSQHSNVSIHYLLSASCSEIYPCLRSKPFTAMKVQTPLFSVEICSFVYGYWLVAMGNIISPPSNVKLEAGDFGEGLVTCITGTYKTARYKSRKDHNLKKPTLVFVR